jgi:hypothetical protein
MNVKKLTNFFHTLKIQFMFKYMFIYIYIYIYIYIFKKKIVKFLKDEQIMKCKSILLVLRLNPIK